MGTPIPPEPPPHGDDCLHFPEPTETPHEIYVYFWGMVVCPFALELPPNMHLFTLVQNDAIPCLWEYENAAFGFTIVLDIQTITPMGLELRHTDTSPYFRAELDGPPAEHQVFTNLQDVCPPTNYAHSGWATMFWLKAARAVINDMNLPTESNIMLEFFVTDEHKPVYKFCFPRYGMNVKFLVSP